MRTSDAKRESQPALAAAAARLPMLSQTACIAELRALGCEVRYAEAEADSPTAELASRRGPGALVASNGELIRQAWSSLRADVPLVGTQTATTSSSPPPLPMSLCSASAMGLIDCLGSNRSIHLFRRRYTSSSTITLPSPPHFPFLHRISLSLLPSSATTSTPSPSCSLLKGRPATSAK